MHANQVVNLLCAGRHQGDLCVVECKDGPTTTAKHRRFDLWVMKRSYSRPCYTGYEVKVSRADFLNDEKWPDYLPNCNQFYFATPWGLVQPDEVPSGCGLIWVSKNLTQCYVKKKAPHRAIEEPVSLMKYILMSRTNVAGERAPHRWKIL